MPVPSKIPTKLTLEGISLICEKNHQVKNRQSSKKDEDVLLEQIVTFRKFIEQCTQSAAKANFM